MKSFGNIVTPYQKAKYDVPLNVCQSVDMADPSVPTLVVGLDRAREVIKDFNILRKQYPNQNMCWTYLRTERGDEYESDLNAFCDRLLKGVVKGSEYRFVDIVKMTYSQAKKFLRYIGNRAPKWWYNDRNVFLFVYDRKHRVVYGLSLSTCRYCGLNPDKVIMRLAANPVNVRLHDFKRIPYGIRKRYGDGLDKYFPLMEHFS